jgi:hypothetical protein
LSNPGAVLRRSLSTFSLKLLVAVSSVNAFHGTAKSFSPMPRKPPKDNTA